MINLEKISAKYYVHRTSSLFRKNQIEKEEFIALENIDLRIPKGTRLGILGLNGAGKTTLLKVLAGTYPIFNGKIKLSDDILALIDISAGLSEDLNAFDNIHTLSLIYALNKNLKKNDYQEIIDFAGIDKVKHQEIRTYSSGMKIRLAFSCITHFMPKCLIMDEWLAVGDEEFKKKAIIRINQMIEKTDYFILSSHDKDLVNKVCNRIITLDKGHIVKDINI